MEIDDNMDTRVHKAWSGLTSVGRDRVHQDFG